MKPVFFGHWGRGWVELASHPGRGGANDTHKSFMHQQQGGGRGRGLVILLVASCNNNQDKLQPDEPLSSIADLNLYSGIRSFLGTAKCFFDPSHPYINMYILHTAPYTFFIVLTRRICLKIMSFFSLQSFPIFS